MGYRIKGKYIKGIDVAGFEVVKDNGETKFMQYADVLTLVVEGKVINATYLINEADSSKIIKIRNGINSIRTVYKVNDIMLEITNRLVDSEGNVVGYKAIDKSGKEHNVSLSKAWELALGNSIKGMEAVVVGGNKVLRAKPDFNLVDIPKVQM